MFDRYEDYFYNVSLFDYGTELEFRVYDYGVPMPGLVSRSKSSAKYEWAEFGVAPFPEYDEFGDPLSETVYDLDELEMRAAKSKRDSIRRTKDHVRMISRGYPWEWFCTFTFSPYESADEFGYIGVSDRYDYDECSAFMKRWLNNMKKQCPGMMYILVPELHQDGAWHFHGLFASCPALRLKFWQHKEGRDLYNITSFRGGHTSASAVSDPEKCSSYIDKYITKDVISVTANKRRYWHSRNCCAPDPIRFFMPKSVRYDFSAMLRSEASYVSHVSRDVGSIQYIHLKKTDLINEFVRLMDEYKV